MISALVTVECTLGNIREGPDIRNPIHIRRYPQHHSETHPHWQMRISCRYSKNVLLIKIAPIL